MTARSISMKGALMLVRDMPDWEMGHICYLDIKLVNSDIHLQFEARLAHREENHYGFVFQSEDNKPRHVVDVHP